MAKMNKDEMFDKYRSRLTGAGSSIKLGAERTTKSQTGNAIKAKQKMMDNLIAALQNGDWEAGLKAAGDEKWLKNLVEKGISKIGAGIDANADEIKAAFGKVLDAADQVQAAVENMPKNNIEDSVARVRKSMEIQKKVHGKS